MKLNSISNGTYQVEAIKSIDHTDFKFDNITANSDQPRRIFHNQSETDEQTKGKNGNYVKIVCRNNITNEYWIRDQIANFTINNVNACNSLVSFKYLVYVYSAVDNFERRTFIRNTWGKHTVFSEGIMKMVFIVGQPDKTLVQDKVRNEASVYKDIIQGDFLDFYQGLSLKSDMVLKWLTTYCPKATFAIKVDDDGFVNYGQLYELLSSMNDTTCTIIRDCHVTQKLTNLSAFWTCY